MILPEYRTGKQLIVQGNTRIIGTCGVVDCIEIISFAPCKLNDKLKTVMVSNC